MIKGISRRVIVVKSPDRRFFEEAIFIVREGVAGSRGVTAEQVVEEARQVADRYVHKQRSRWLRLLPLLGSAAAGAAVTGLAWALTVLG